MSVTLGRKIRALNKRILKCTPQDSTRGTVVVGICVFFLFFWQFFHFSAIFFLLFCLFLSVCSTAHESSKSPYYFFSQFIIVILPLILFLYFPPFFISIILHISLNLISVYSFPLSLPSHSRTQPPLAQFPSVSCSGDHEIESRQGRLVQFLSCLLSVTVGSTYS